MLEESFQHKETYEYPCKYNCGEVVERTMKPNPFSVRSFSCFTCKGKMSKKYAELSALKQKERDKTRASIHHAVQELAGSKEPHQG